MSLSANRLVAEGVPRQAELLVDLVDHGVTPHMLLLRDEAGGQRPDIRSYTGALLYGSDKQPAPPLRGHAARLVHHAGSLGLDLAVEQIGSVETLPRDEIIPRIEEAGEDPGIHGIMVLTPLEKLSGEGDTRYRAFMDEVMAAIPLGKDIDFGNPYFATLNGSRPIPPTPRATIETLNSHGFWSRELHYTLQGPQGKVGGPIASELKRLYGEDWYKSMVYEIERENEGELPRKMAESDVVIAAAGAYRRITVEGLRQAGEAGRLKAIAAVGLHDFEPGARELAEKLGIRTTPAHMDPEDLGVGGGTAFYAWDNMLRSAAANLAKPQASVAVG